MTQLKIPLKKKNNKTEEMETIKHGLEFRVMRLNKNRFFLDICFEGNQIFEVTPDGIKVVDEDFTIISHPLGCMEVQKKKNVGESK